MSYLKLRNSILFLIIILSHSCKTDEHPVPMVSFSVQVDLDLPDFAGEVFILPSVFMGRRVGVSGVIVYRISYNEYVAFDRYCTYDKDPRCMVFVDDNNSIAICSCCKSEFLISSFDIADVINGPATIALRKYNTRVEGRKLIIYQ